MPKIGEIRKNSDGVTEQYVGASTWKQVKTKPKKQQTSNLDQAEVRIGSDIFTATARPTDFTTKDKKTGKETVKTGLYVTLKPNQAIRGYGTFYLRPPVEE
jgi:hypothetical protein